MNIRFNTIIPIVFMLVIVSSVDDLRFELSNLDKAYYLIMGIVHIVLILFSVYALMITLRKYHIIIDDHNFIIREGIIGKEKTIALSSIQSVDWTTQKEGVWLKGRWLFIITLNNDESIKLNSLNMLFKKTRNNLFKHLEERGILVKSD